MEQITKRLKPGEDLREGIEKIVKENSVKAGVLVSVVGALSKASLRMPGGKIVKTWEKDFEIASGTGTVSVNGCHLHISLSDIEGSVIGGHLVMGCTVRVTAEIVLLVFDDVEYTRKLDPETGFDELEVN